MRLPQKRRKILPFLAFGVGTGIISQLSHGHLPVNANLIGEYLGAMVGGAFMGWLVYWFAERFYPQKL